MTILWDRPLLTLGGAAVTPPGSFIFSLDGALEGLTVIRDGLPVVVPAAALLSAVTELQHGPPVGGADLGAEFAELTSRLAIATETEHGVVVTNVRSTGPAAQTLRIGDVIETFDGAAVYSAELLRVRVARLAPGTPVTLRIVRDRTTADLTLTLGGVGTAQAIKSRSSTQLGVTLRDRPGRGADVLHVVAHTAASDAGLSKGDLIVRFGGEMAPASTTITRGFAAALHGEYLLVGVARGSEHRVLALHKP